MFWQYLGISSLFYLSGDCVAVCPHRLNRKLAGDHLGFRQGTLG